MIERPTWPAFPKERRQQHREVVGEWQGYRVKFIADYIGLSVSIWRDGEQVLFQHANGMTTAGWIAEGFIREKMSTDDAVCECGAKQGEPCRVSPAEEFCPACRWYGVFMAAVCGALDKAEYQRVIEATREATGQPPPHSVEAMEKESQLCSGEDQRDCGPLEIGENCPRCGRPASKGTAVLRLGGWFCANEKACVERAHAQRPPDILDCFMADCDSGASARDYLVAVLESVRDIEGDVAAEFLVKAMTRLEKRVADLEAKEVSS
ncbi:MAG: hypothetical protein GY838_13105 [bacterium]|nr:hypothetical protein [bacterium]